jgi:hypothetical protein
MTWTCQKCGRENDAPHGFFDALWALIMFAAAFALAIGLFQFVALFRRLCGFGG